MLKKLCDSCSEPVGSSMLKTGGMINIKSVGQVFVQFSTRGKTPDVCDSCLKAGMSTLGANNVVAIKRPNQ